VSCSKCSGGTGWVRVEVNGVESVKRCVCQKQKRREVHMRQLPPLFRGIDVKSFTPRSRTQKSAWDIVQKDPKGSYLFVGKFGAGKSYLMATQFILRDNSKCRYYLTIDLMETIRHATMEGEVWIPPLGEEDHWFLDDITQCKGSDHRDEKLFYLIDKLLTHESGLSLTSSIGVKELDRILPGSTMRRIKDMCQEVKL